jgi:hypothetical protein
LGTHFESINISIEDSDDWWLWGYTWISSRRENFYILTIFIQYFNNNRSKKSDSNSFGRASGAT